MSSISKASPVTTANGSYNYDIMIGNKSLDSWVQEVHKVFASKYKWRYAPLKVGSFGYDNMACSIGYAYEMLLQTIETRNVSAKDAAIWVHDGWTLNYKFWRDHQPWKLNKTHLYIKPSTTLGDTRRDVLANTPYDDLPEDEKEKDDIIASYFLTNVEL